MTAKSISHISIDEARNKHDGASSTLITAFAKKHRSATRFILTSITIANFTDIFIYCAIIPVAPFALPVRADVDPDDVQYWVSIMLAVYNVFSIVTALPSAWISDKLGLRKPIFVIGTLIQFAGLALVTIGTNIPIWLAGRALQGVACAIVLTTTLPLLLHSAPKKQSGRYLGIFAVSSSAALAVGPLIGGIVYEKSGYIPVFAICFALNGLDFIVRSLTIEIKPFSPPTTTDQIDPEKVSQIPTATTTATSLSSAMTSTHSSPSTDSIILPLLSSSRLLAALYLSLLYTTIQTAFEATLPLFVRETFNWDPLGAGLIFIPLLLSDLCGPVFGYVSDRLGPRLTCSIGLIIGIAPLVCLRFVNEDTTADKILLVTLIALAGFGTAAVLPAAMAVVGEVVEAKGVNESGTARAYGLFNIAYSAGCLIGPVWGGLVRESDGWGVMGWTLALLWASGLVPTLVWLK